MVPAAQICAAGESLVNYYGNNRQPTLHNAVFAHLYVVQVIIIFNPEIAIIAL